MKSLEEINNEYSLRLIETTSSGNGYPTNLKYALIGFDTFEDAQKIATENNLSIQFFKKKDGWQLWYRTNNIANNPMQNKAEDYGDNFKVYDPEFYSDIDVLYENEFKSLIKENDLNFKEVKELVKTIENIYDEIQSCDGDQIVITDTYETHVVDKLTMYWNHDTNQIAIGLIEND